MSVIFHEQTWVLHVDDEPSITDLAGTFLEREDDRFTVETATSADEGLERINDRPPDCVVSDYNMPGMDGIEFLQAVREEYPDLPFILYTGRGSEAVASEAIAGDVTDYLQKGSGSEQYELLANRIRNAVQARRETQRADRQEQLMRLTELAGDTGGFELDTETGEMLMTDGLRQLIDLPAQADLSLEEGLEMYHPEDREDIRRTIDRARQTGEQIHGTWRLQAQDGNERIVDVTFTPATTDGDTEILRGSVHDVTDQHERRQELRRNKRAMDEAPIGMTISDPAQDGHPLIYTNDRFVELTGYDEDEIVGRNWQFLQGDDTRAEPVAQIREAIDAQDPVTVELRNYRKDGTEFWNRVSIAPVRDDQGSVVNFVGFQQDITDRKQMERDLRQERNLVTRIVETSPVGISVVTTDGDISFVNEQSSTIAGWSPEEVTDRSYNHSRYDLVNEDGDPFDAGGTPFARVMSQETAVHDQVVGLRRPSGERTWLSVSGAPQYNDDGEFERTVFAYEDITDHKRSEEKLKRQNNRLEEFASVVSHDLRSPLGVAEGHLELAEETLESEHLRKARDAIERGQALVDDLLALAREGDEVAETESLELAEVAESSWQTVETAQATLDAGGPGVIEADHRRLQQLFENLYRNAVEHGGDDITVSVGAMDGGFHVADTGPGIPEAHRGGVFEVGYSTTEEGTGFGLRIVEQIAEAHGWEIAVTESKQGGARFEFTDVEMAD